MAEICFVLRSWSYCRAAPEPRGSGDIAGVLGTKALLIPVFAHSCCLLLTARLHIPGVLGPQRFPLAMESQNIHLSLLGLCLVKSTQSLSQSCQCSCYTDRFGDAASHPRAALTAFSLKRISLIVYMDILNLDLFL